MLFEGRYCLLTVVVLLSLPLQWQPSPSCKEKGEVDYPIVSIR